MASGAGGPGGGAGGGAGGGKIRTRRCQQRPTEPYQRGRPWHWGILSRVSESVKNIMPQWLQRYFNRNEGVCSCSTDSREAPQCPENREDDHLINADEESVNNHDDRNSHEPTVSNAEDSAVSKNTSAPPLPSPAAEHSRSLSQHTATSSKKPAFSVGLGGSQTVCPGKTRYSGAAAIARLSQVRSIPYQVPRIRQIKAKQPSYGVTSFAARRILQCLEEMTSPLLVGSPSPAVKKLLIPRPVSSAAGQTISFKPSLNPSGELKKTNQKIDKRHSTEYDKNMTPGRNIEQQDSMSVANGIASGVGTADGKMSRGTTQLVATKRPEEAVPLIRQTKTNQLNAPSCGATSLAARRIILQYLEKMSSPLEDRKRIPSVVSSHLNSVGCPYPPIKKLLIPRPVSSTAGQTIYFKPSLNPSGELKKTNQKIDKRHSTVYDKNMTPGRNIEQQDSMSVASGIASGVGTADGKMSRGTTHLVATKRPEEAEMEVPVLPRITLPITSSSLPTFNFGSSVMTSPSLISPVPSLANKVQMTSSNNTGSSIFRFSSPIVISTEADVPPPSSIGLTFSVPVAKTSELSGSSSSSEPITSSSAQDITTMNSSSCKKQLDEGCESLFRPAIILKEGSVLDVLKNPDEYTAYQSLSIKTVLCSYGRTPDDCSRINQVVGFTTPKADSPAAQPTTTSPVVYTGPAISSFSSSGIGFEESLKAGSTRQCDSCLLQNKVTDKYVACQASKLPPRDTAKQTGIGTPSKSGKPTLCFQNLSLMQKFKPAVVTWDCDTCLVQNKPEAIRCVACETPKPGTGVNRVLTLPGASESAVTVAASSSSSTVTTGLGFGDKFKRPVGSWACPVCCVSKNAEDNKCVSCISEKPDKGPLASPVLVQTPGASATPSMGLSQGSGEPTQPAFGSLSSSSTSFPAGPQPALLASETPASGNLPWVLGPANIPSGFFPGLAPNMNTGPSAPPVPVLTPGASATPSMGLGQGCDQQTQPALGSVSSSSASFPAGPPPAPLTSGTPASRKRRRAWGCANIPSGFGPGLAPNTNTGPSAPSVPMLTPGASAMPSMRLGQGSGQQMQPVFVSQSTSSISFPAGTQLAPLTIGTPTSGKRRRVLGCANIPSGLGLGLVPNTNTGPLAPPVPVLTPGASATPSMGLGHGSDQQIQATFVSMFSSSASFPAGTQPAPLASRKTRIGIRRRALGRPNILSVFESGVPPNMNTGTLAPPVPVLTPGASATPSMGLGQGSDQQTQPALGSVSSSSASFPTGPPPAPMASGTPASGNLPWVLGPANILSGFSPGLAPNMNTVPLASPVPVLTPGTSATPSMGLGHGSNQHTQPAFGSLFSSSASFPAAPQPAPKASGTPASGNLPGVLGPANIPSGFSPGLAPNMNTGPLAPPVPVMTPGASAKTSMGLGQGSDQQTQPTFGSMFSSSASFPAWTQTAPLASRAPRSGRRRKNLEGPNILSGFGTGVAPNTILPRSGGQDGVPTILTIIIQILVGFVQQDMGTSAPPVPVLTPGSIATPSVGLVQRSDQHRPPAFGSMSASSASFSARPQPAPMPSGTTAIGNLPWVLGPTNVPSGFGPGPAPNMNTETLAPPVPVMTPGASALPSMGLGQGSGHRTQPALGSVSSSSASFPAGPPPAPLVSGTPASGNLPGVLGPANILSGFVPGLAPNMNTGHLAPPVPVKTPGASATTSMGLGTGSDQKIQPALGSMSSSSASFPAGIQPAPLPSQKPRSGRRRRNLGRPNIFSGFGLGVAPKTNTGPLAPPVPMMTPRASATPSMGLGQGSDQQTQPALGSMSSSSASFPAGPPPAPVASGTPASGNLPWVLGPANIPSGFSPGLAPNMNTGPLAPPVPVLTPGASATPSMGLGQGSDHRTQPAFGSMSSSSASFPAGPPPAPVASGTPASGNLPGVLGPANIPSVFVPRLAPNMNTGPLVPPVPVMTPGSSATTSMGLSTGSYQQIQLALGSVFSSSASFPAGNQPAPLASRKPRSGRRRRNLGRPNILSGFGPGVAPNLISPSSGGQDGVPTILTIIIQILVGFVQQEMGPLAPPVPVLTPGASATPSMGLGLGSDQQTQPALGSMSSSSASFPAGPLPAPVASGMPASVNLPWVLSPANIPSGFSPGLAPNMNTGPLAPPVPVLTPGASATPSMGLGQGSEQQTQPALGSMSSSSASFPAVPQPAPVASRKPRSGRRRRAMGRPNIPSGLGPERAPNMNTGTLAPPVPVLTPGASATPSMGLGQGSDQHTQPALGSVSSSSASFPTGPPPAPMASGTPASGNLPGVLGPANIPSGFSPGLAPNMNTGTLTPPVPVLTPGASATPSMGLGQGSDQQTQPSLGSVFSSSASIPAGHPPAPVASGTPASGNLPGVLGPANIPSGFSPGLAPNMNTGTLAPPVPVLTLGASASPSMGLSPGSDQQTQPALGSVSSTSASIHAGPPPAPVASGTPASGNLPWVLGPANIPSGFSPGLAPNMNTGTLTPPVPVLTTGDSATPSMGLDQGSDQQTQPALGSVSSSSASFPAEPPPASVASGTLASGNLPGVLGPANIPSGFSPGLAPNMNTGTLTPPVPVLTTGDSATPSMGLDQGSDQQTQPALGSVSSSSASIPAEPPPASVASGTLASGNLPGVLGPANIPSGFSPGLAPNMNTGTLAPPVPMLTPGASATPSMGLGPGSDQQTQPALGSVSSSSASIPAGPPPASVASGTPASGNLSGVLGPANIPSGFSPGLAPNMNTGTLTPPVPVLTPGASATPSMGLGPGSDQQTQPALGSVSSSSASIPAGPPPASVASRTPASGNLPGVLGPANIPSGFSPGLAPNMILDTGTLTPPVPVLTPGASATPSMGLGPGSDQQTQPALGSVSSSSASIPAGPPPASVASGTPASGNLPGVLGPANIPSGFSPGLAPNMKTGNLAPPVPMLTPGASATPSMGLCQGSDQQIQPALGSVSSSSASFPAGPPPAPVASGTPANGNLPGVLGPANIPSGFSPGLAPIMNTGPLAPHGRAVIPATSTTPLMVPYQGSSQVTLPGPVSIPSSATVNSLIIIMRNLHL